MTGILATYQLAILMTALLLIAVHAQNFLSALYKIIWGKQPPGKTATGDYDNKTFRFYRTHMNSVENLSMFIAALALAMITGVNASLVTWLVAIHVIARLAFWGVYYSGIGAIAGGVRTIVFVIGFTASVILAASALRAAF